MGKCLAFLILGFILLGCKMQTSSAPDPFTTESISESKKNNYFISEYIPQRPYIELGGERINIIESWTEYPHRKDIWGNKIDSSLFCLVIRFDMRQSNQNLDLYSYVKGLVNSSGKVWITLDLQKIENDTLKFQYRSSLSQERRNQFFCLQKKTF